MINFSSIHVFYRKENFIKYGCPELLILNEFKFNFMYIKEEKIPKHRCSRISNFVENIGLEPITFRLPV